MRSHPSYFMGHKIICNANTMDYTICDDYGNKVNVELWRLENDSEYMSSIVDVVNSWQRSNSSVIDASNIVAGNITARSKPDLRDVSTSDLLNEAFKRGAIKHMKRKVAVHTEYMHDPEYVKHLQVSAIHDSLLAAKDKLLNEGVFHLASGDEDRFNGTLEYSAEYFICKHPLTLKKEEGRAK